MSAVKTLPENPTTSEPLGVGSAPKYKLKSNRNRCKITLIAKYVQPSEAQRDTVSAVLLSFITELKEARPTTAIVSGNFSNSEEVNS